MPLTENHDIYDNPNLHGTTALINGSSVNGIFDEEYVEVTIGGVSVSGVKPVFNCAVENLPSYGFDTEVVIDSVTYKIKAWQPDGTGRTDLILEKQP